MIPITKKDLEEAKKSYDYVEATMHQIQKDFQLHEEEIRLNVNSKTAYDDLYRQILPIMDRLLNLDTSKFFSLLYSIDINESTVKRLLFEKHKQNPTEELSHLIIERELMKVVSRRYFSMKK